MNYIEMNRARPDISKENRETSALSYGDQSMNHRIVTRGLVLAAALILLSPSLSLAQQNPQSDQTNQRGRSQSGAQRPNKGQTGQSNANHRRRPQTGNASGRPPQAGNRPGRPSQATNRPGRPPQAGNRRGRPSQATNRPGRPPQAGNRRSRPTQWSPRPPRPNQFYHQGRWSGRIRGPGYMYPRGWNYRRWAIGARLPPILFGPSYFYTGWAALGLAAPLPGYQWVRFGPDLLLVNVRTGEVEDVIYGAFY